MQKINIVIIATLLLSCSPELPDRNELVQSLYNEKVKRLKDDKDQICKENLLDKAISDVDSLVHDLINRDLMDTLNFPGKPKRPATQKHIIGQVNKFELEEKLEK